MSDLISRQAAIDKVDRIIEVNHLNPDMVWFTPNGVKTLMEDLPSAQTEQNMYVVTYQDGDEEPVLSVFNNEVAAIAYRDEEGKNHDRIWLDEAPIFSKTLVDGRWFG